MPQAQVIFNYLGQTDQSLPEGSPFAGASESSGPAHHPQGQRTHTLEVIGLVSGGQLQITWTASAELHQRATIERLAGRYMQALRDLIDHCLSPEAGGYTPSDFPEAELSQEAMDLFFSKIAQTGKE
jgi:non-ribosomal peptide synthase protein (TIGR01720 family)